MARKQRRKPANRPRQRPSGLPPQQPQQLQPQQDQAQPGTPVTAAAAAPAARPAGSPRVGGDQALVRAVEMSLAPAPPGSRRGGRQMLLPDTGDASIPLDRVPYFTSDLVRVAVTGAIMIALLVVAALTVIPKVVK